MASSDLFGETDITRDPDTHAILSLDEVDEAATLNVALAFIDTFQHADDASAERSMAMTDAMVPMLGTPPSGDASPCGGPPTPNWNSHTDSDHSSDPPHGHDESDPWSTEKMSSQMTLTTASSTTPWPVRKTTKEPIRKRKSKREELISLRTRVQELYSQLAMLREQAKNPSSSMGTSSWPNLLAQTPARPPVWEAIAHRQYEQRYRVEQENIQLRVRMADQIKVLRGLERFLTSRTTTTLAPQLDFTWGASYGDVDAKKRREILDELEGSLVGMHEGVDDVFSDPRLMGASTPFRMIEVCPKTEIEGPSVEILDMQEFPFHYRAVADALWVESSSKSATYHQQVISRSADTMLKTFGAQFRFARVYGETRAAALHRRFDEPNRVVLIWSTLMDPCSISGHSVRGTHVRYLGWMTITPTLTDRSHNSSLGGSTCVKTFELVTPEIVQGSANRAQIFDVLTHCVVETSHFQLMNKRQTTENRLLEQELKANIVSVSC